MSNNYNQIPLSLRITRLIGAFLVVLGFTILANVVNAVVFTWVAGQELNLNDIAAIPSPALKKAFWVSQFAGAVVGLVVLPLLYIRFFRPDINALLTPQKSRLPEFVALALLVFITFLPTLSWVIEWNKNLHLPAHFFRIEQWMAQLEKQLDDLTQLIVSYDSFPSFITCLVVIAILPAVSEELVFRGIMQNEFNQALKNPHAAIWLSAFFFSFFHLQFFGFFPRMLLGALFGYIYYWSGNLFTSMFLHFVNNAISLIALNLKQKDIISFDPEAADNFPASVVIVSVGLTAFFLFFYYSMSKKEKRLL